MGSKGGGSSSSSSGFSAGTSTYSPNPEAMASYRKALSMAENVASIPYQPYQGQMVAGFTPDQMAAFQATRNMQGMSQPYINTGLGMLNQAVNYADPRLFNAQTLAQYQNPYQQQVVDATMENLKELQAQGELQNRTRAAQAGTFGGSGEFRGRAEIARQQAMANAQTLAGLQQQGYQQAVNQYNQQQQQAISTAQNAAYGLGQLGNQAQQAALQSIQALLGTGQMQQAMAQQQLTGAYNQWMQARAYPYQQTAFYSGIASGIAPNMGGTTTSMGFNMGNQQQQQQGGGGGGGMGMLSSVMSFLPMLMSDERTKTNIEEVGEDRETGLPLYAYDDIADVEAAERGERPLPPKRVSVMAQDLETVQPDDVVDLGSLKAINPDFREHAADGGAQGMALGSGTGMPGDASQGFGSLGQSIYAAPSTPSMPTASQAPQAGGQALGALGVPTQGSQLDPGLSQFLQSTFDPQTADKIARSKWVNQPQAPGEQPMSGDSYVIPPGLMGDGGETYPYHPQANMPKAYGGRAERAVGGGSFFDIVKKGGIQGPFAEAPDNYMAAAQELGIGKIIPQAKDIAKDITKSGAEGAMKDAAQAAKGQGGGGGGSGGGGGGAPKMPSMKGSGKSAVPSKEAPFDPGQASPAAQPGVAAQPEASGQTQGVGPGAQEAAKTDFSFAEHAAPLPESSPVVEHMQHAPAMDMAPPPMEPMVMPTIEPQIPLLGMFGGFAEGGRVHKDGGGAAGGFGDAPGAGFGAMPTDGGFASLGQGGGFGDVVLGKAASPADASGFANLMKGQETLTGENLMGKLTKQYWERDPGEQTSPVEQGMPAMPDSKYYTTPREDLPGKLMSENYGKENQSEIPGMMAMMGGKGMGGLGLAMMINQQQRAANAGAEQAKLQKTRAEMLADPKNYPVEGYFSEISSTPAGKPEMGMQLNPRTGLYNLKYTGAYRGLPYKDGGRVPLADGGDPLFKRIVGKTFGYEGGYNPGDTGGETMYGISKKAHPGLNIKGVTKGAAEDIYKKEYYDAIGASHLPPALRMAAFDTAVIAGPGRAREFLSKSGGDPLKFLDLRDRFMHGLVASNPAKYGKYEKGWNNRNADLRKTVAGMMGERTEPERAVAYDPQARPLAFKPKETAQSVFTRPPEALSSKPVEVATRQAAPAGSVLNRINPKDPSGPLLPESHPIAAAPAPTPAVAPQPSRIAEAAPKRHFSLGDLNPISTAHAGDRGVYPTGPAVDDEVRVPKIDKGPAATEPKHPTWNSAPEGTYGPGISEKQSFMTDFGQLPNRDMLAETPYAQTMAGAPLSSFGDVQPPAPAPEAAPAPEPIAAGERATPAPATGQKYWGDWRDAEPFKSDPIGQFFDSLSGETPHAAAPGHIEPQGGFDLGQMSGGVELPNIELPFKAGGVVRAHKADGGYLDPFNALGEGLGAIGEGIGSAVSSIGEGLGGLFEGEQPQAQAEPQASGVAQPSAYERWAENPFSQFLWNAGQAMMSRPNASPLEALSTGLPHGMSGAMEAGRLGEKRAVADAERASELAFQQQLAGGEEQPEPAAAGYDPASRTKELMSEISRVSRIPATGKQISEKNAYINGLMSQVKFLQEQAKAERGELGVIGKDEFGDPIRGWISGPKAGQPLEVQKPTTETGEPKPAENLHGDEYLSTLPAERQDYIRGIAQGDIEAPKGAAGTRIRAIVKQFDPNWNDDVWRQRRDMRKAYEPEGKIGQQMVGASTALGHAQQLLDVADRLNNYSVPAVNAVKNMFGQATGSDVVNDFNMNRDALVAEMEKYFKGGAPAESSVKRALHELNANSSPQQIATVVRKAVDLMQTKTKAYVGDWERTFGPISQSGGKFFPRDLSENEKIERDIIQRHRKIAPDTAKSYEEHERARSEKPVAADQPSSYSGPIITNAKGEKMRLSDDKKSWVKF